MVFIGSEVGEFGVREELCLCACTVHVAEKLCCCALLRLCASSGESWYFEQYWMIGMVTKRDEVG